MSTCRLGGRAKCILGLALLVVLAGCTVAAPMSDDSGLSSTPEMESTNDAGGDETPAETPQEDAEDTTQTDTAGSDASEQSQTDEEGGNERAEDGDTATSADGLSSGPIDDSALPVDANRIYNQTATLLNSDAEPPSLNVRNISQTVGMTANPFFEYLGLINDTQSSDEGVGAVGYATGPDTVVINDQYTSENLSTERERYLETTLAHEFVHTIQFEEGWLRPAWDESPTADRSTLEFTLLVRSLVEGGAVDATDEYADATGMRVQQGQQFQRAYREATPDEKLSYAPYNFGAQYFDSVLDNARKLGSVYEENPPRTTTEIRHPERDGFEPTPVEFSVDVETDDWQQRIDMTDTTGELFFHIALSAYTDSQTADEAATGWANDRLFAFGYQDDLSYTWATHWQSAEDAAQFATAFNASIGARADTEASQLDVRFAGERSVVIVAGDQSFRDAVVVEGTNTDLDIVVTGDDQSAALAERTAPTLSENATPSPA